MEGRGMTPDKAVDLSEVRFRYEVGPRTHVVIRYHPIGSIHISATHCN